MPYAMPERYCREIQHFTWLFTLSEAQMAQNALDGQVCPMMLGHWCLHFSSLSQRCTAGRTAHGAPHGKGQPGTVQRSTHGVHTCMQIMSTSAAIYCWKFWSAWQRCLLLFKLSAG